MFDLTGGANTPTMGLYMTNLAEHAPTNDLRSLNGHLRLQSFTMITSEGPTPDLAGRGRRRRHVSS